MTKTFYLRDAGVKQRLIEYIAGLPVDADKPLMVSVAAYRKKPTQDQREMLHGVIGQIAEATPWSAAAWKEFFKRQFIGADEITLPGGRVIEQGRSTESLSRKEYAELTDKVISYAQVELGLKI